MGNGGCGEDSNSRAGLAHGSTVFEAGPLDHSGTHPDMEEKRGFGPLCRIPATTAFPMRAIRPLWHFSGKLTMGWRKTRESNPRPRGVLDTWVQARRNRPLCQSSGHDGAESRNRICDARAFNAMLYRLSYLGMMGGAPRGSRISGFLLDREALWPLSYRSRKMVEMGGYDPPAVCVQGRCSPS